MKRNKDILFLCQYFYPEYVSSATLPYDTAEALVKAGFSVGVLCGYPKEYNNIGEVPLNETHEGIEIKRLKYIQLKRSNFIGRLINYFSFTISVALRFRYLRNYKSIIVYSNPPILPYIAALANKFFGVRVIYVCYDVYPEIAYITNSISETSIISKMMKFINKTVFRYTTKVVALSNEMKDYLLKHRPLLKNCQVSVIPNWYDNKEVNDITLSYQSDLFNRIEPQESLIVSYFGNLGICQDLETILDAVKGLRDDCRVKFVFAGHGNKMELLRGIVEKEGIKNVIIYDFLHGQDFQYALSISDCFLISLADGLTGLAVPSKTYSYMMAGKPIIAIIGDDSDIARDIKDNNAGYSMQVGESYKLISAIKELRDNDDKRKKMGENCRSVFIKKYTKEKCTQQYVDMIKGIFEV